MNRILISCSLVNSPDKKESEEEKNEINNSPSLFRGEPGAYFLVTTLFAQKIIGQEGKEEDRKEGNEELTLILLSRWSVRRERKHTLHS